MCCYLRGRGNESPRSGWASGEQQVYKSGELVAACNVTPVVIAHPYRHQWSFYPKSHLWSKKVTSSEEGLY